jgi:type II secretory pathway pseudopilin PulG
MKSRTGGFTIIEVSLWISITGLLMMLLLVGWNISINTQSYHDSTRSFATFLQQQYTGIMDVTNDRDAKKTCSIQAGGTKAEVADAPTVETRGQTDCVLLGKYIYTDGTKAVSYTVIGKDKPDETIPALTDEKQTFTKTAATVMKTSDGAAPTAYTIPWTPKLYEKSDVANTKLIIAIMRSPTTGAVYTRWTTTSVSVDDSSTPLDVFGTDATKYKTDELVMCFDPQTAVTGERQAVRIEKNASSMNSVSVLTANAGCDP